MQDERLAQAHHEFHRPPVIPLPNLAKEAYNKQYRKVMNARDFRNSFTQIVGEHAIRMCELAHADRNASKRGLLQTGGHVARLNDEWVQLVCLGEPMGSEFHTTTNGLVCSYSDAIGDFVFDRSYHPEKIDALIDMEARFYAQLGAKVGRLDEMKSQWVDYTHSILSMVRAMDQYGSDSDTFYYNAANCIQSGVLLGVWLDHTLYHK